MQPYFLTQPYAFPVGEISPHGVAEFSILVSIIKIMHHPGKNQATTNVPVTTPTRAPALSCLRLWTRLEP